MNVEIDDMTEEQVKTALKKLVSALDELDVEDYFGTEGWRHYLGIAER